jgi:hypothetical protein
MSHEGVQGESGSISRIADFLIKGTKHAVLFKRHRGSSENAVFFSQDFIDFLRCLPVLQTESAKMKFLLQVISFQSYE